MIFGFAEAIRRHKLTKEIGPCGGTEARRKWHKEIALEGSQIDEGMIHFSTMIASLGWCKEGDETAVIGVIDVFHLIPVGRMSPPVVTTLIKWLGADLKDAESCNKTVDKLIEMLNHHWSGWARVEPIEKGIPALEEERIFLPLQEEMQKILPIPYAIAHPDD